MATQRTNQLLALLMIMTACNFHATCMGFLLPPDLLLPTTNPPSSDSNTPSPAAAQETEESEQYNSTEPLEILQGSFSTEAPPDMDSSSNEGAVVACQVELYEEQYIPLQARIVKLGYAVKKPWQFEIGEGLDLGQGEFEAPSQGIYYFLVSVHVKEFPSDTGALSGAMGLGVCIDKNCDGGNLQGASLSDAALVQMEGFIMQTSGLLKLKTGQVVTVILVNSCNTAFTIKTSSLSIFKLT